MYQDQAGSVPASLLTLIRKISLCRFLRLREPRGPQPPPAEARKHPAIAGRAPQAAACRQPTNWIQNRRGGYLRLAFHFPPFTF